MRVAFETHGCKLNQADTLKLSSEFFDAGFKIVKETEACDVYVLNSCTVTHIADRKGRNSARSAKKLNPNSFVVFTGCYAERDPISLEAIQEIDLVLGNVSKKDIVNRVIDELKIEVAPAGDSFAEPPMESFSTKTRAMVKIQEGCNQICSYCIVPKVRGREKSVPVSELISQINHLQKSGFKEVVLTGTQLGSYGFDLTKTNLKSMLLNILNNTEIPRIRVSSLQHQEIDLDLLDLWQDTRLCRHFHIPLQSGSNSILKAMRRRYTSEQYMESIDQIKSVLPDASITSDVIVGFPNESEEDFHNTANLCRSVSFSDLHVFKFSSRPGTSAAHLPDNVTYSTKSKRSKDLILIAEAGFHKYRESHIGKQEYVLWEESSNKNVINNLNTYTGLTSNYIRVKSESEKEITGLIEPVTLGMSTNPKSKMMTAIR